MQESHAPGPQDPPEAEPGETRIIRFNALLVIAASHELLNEVSSHIHRNFSNCRVIRDIPAAELSSALEDLQAPAGSAASGDCAWSSSEPRRDEGPKLSARQMAVLHHLADGLINKQIAGKMNVCEATVKAHLSQIYRVLGVFNRTQALAVARLRGWLR